MANKKDWMVRQDYIDRDGGYFVFEQDQWHRSSREHREKKLWIAATKYYNGPFSVDPDDGWGWHGLAKGIPFPFFLSNRRYYEPIPVDEYFAHETDLKTGRRPYIQCFQLTDFAKHGLHSDLYPLNEVRKSYNEWYNCTGPYTPANPEDIEYE